LLKDIHDIYIRSTDAIRDAISCIDISGRISIALLVDEEERLIATITDGDIRRAILAGISLDAPLSLLMSIKEKSEHPSAVTAQIGADSESMLQLMKVNRIRQLPLLDEQQHVVKVVTLDDLQPVESLGVRAVIMAGGLGTRLRPLTNDTPKPMLPIGDRPMLQVIIGQLLQSGIQNAYITTHYLSEKIVDYFGDGSRFGINLQYINENQPLGTAGALGFIDDIVDPLLVINGDILTNLDFRKLLLYHNRNKADMTIGVRQYDMQVPYGVVECTNGTVVKVHEKPIYNYLVNSGIYLLEPDILCYIPKGRRFDMTDLIDVLIKHGKRVVSFPIMEYWLDIGQSTDYFIAQEEVKNGRWKH